MQTAIGGKKVVKTMTKKYGGRKAWLAHMREIASKGGQAKVPKGFALMTPEQRSAYGVKGGSISKRRKVK
jgi:general stress protein YciG